ncbi:HNH endonuclease [Listeria booriae]|uniref:HNH endonuclease n=1 Tax=Listeria booriae TaxID=1552123 RepID=UPI0016248BAB|nr:HNH endonuclease signature motif containing protein [Listeria booriae]MBC1247336.1 HNH endonuclease [Listeria booriae]
MTTKLLQYILTGQLIRFYKTKEWKTLREIALKRDNYECQRCKKRGLYAKADCVHHVQYVKSVPTLALTLANLESLCNPCHNKEHNRLPNQKKAKSKRFVSEESW